MVNEIRDELNSKYGEGFYWGWVNDDVSNGYMKEINIELGKKHHLYNKIKCFVGKCFASDDALYMLKDGKAAIVHLTWSRKEEKIEESPTYTEFLNLKSAIQYIEEEFVELQQHFEDNNNYANNIMPKPIDKKIKKISIYKVIILGWILWVVAVFVFVSIYNSILK